jgi:hypothetical protein
MGGLLRLGQLISRNLFYRACNVTGRIATLPTTSNVGRWIIPPVRNGAMQSELNKP